MGLNGSIGFALLIVSPFAVAIAAGLGAAIGGAGAAIAGVMAAVSICLAIYKFAPATSVSSWHRRSRSLRKLET